MTEGQCEVDPERPCAWARIVERLAAEGRLDRIAAPFPLRDYRRQTRPGKVTHRAYLRRYHAGSK
jgi:hypothetical protein